MKLKWRSFLPSGYDEYEKCIVNRYDRLITNTSTGATRCKPSRVNTESKRLSIGHLTKTFYMKHLYE